MTDWTYSRPVIKSWNMSPDDGVRISAEAGAVCIAVLDDDKTVVMNLRFDPLTARGFADQLLAAADAAGLMKSAKRS